jgi:hypothetical protein
VSSTNRFESSSSILRLGMVEAQDIHLEVKLKEIQQAFVGIGNLDEKRKIQLSNTMFHKNSLKIHISSVHDI